MEIVGVSEGGYYECERDEAAVEDDGGCRSAD
jgi:hypothetical protein